MSNINPVTQSQQASPTTSAASKAVSIASSTGGLANESTFLTLLVAQLKNQDPMSPTDGTQFVTQLAQFSSLEQLININTNVGSISKVVNPTTASTTGSSSSSSDTSSANSLMNALGSAAANSATTNNSNITSLIG